MTHREFARLASAERRIAREALLDAALSQYFEPLSVTCLTSATQDTPQAAHIKEVLDEDTLPFKSMRSLSFIFQGDELNEIFAASTAPPPPLRRLGRGAATASRACSWEQEAEDLPDARVAWGTLAQRFKLALPALPEPNADDHECATRSPSASFVCDASSFSTFGKTTSASDTFYRRQAMSARRKRALEDLHLLAC